MSTPQTEAKKDGATTGLALATGSVSVMMRDGAWTAHRLPKSRAFVKFTKRDDPTDGMMWTAPTNELMELVWMLTWSPAALTREDQLVIASALESYRALVLRTKATRNPIAHALSRIISSPNVPDEPRAEPPRHVER